MSGKIKAAIAIRARISERLAQRLKLIAENQPAIFQVEALMLRKPLAVEKSDQKPCRGAGACSLEMPVQPGPRFGGNPRATAVVTELQSWMPAGQPSALKLRMGCD